MGTLQTSLNIDGERKQSNISPRHHVKRSGGLHCTRKMNDQHECFIKKDNHTKKMSEPIPKSHYWLLSIELNRTELNLLTCDSVQMSPGVSNVVKEYLQCGSLWKKHFVHIFRLTTIFPRFRILPSMLT